MLIVLWTAACTAKQSKKRKTTLKKATNKNELDSSRGDTRVTVGVDGQRFDDN